MTNLTDKVVIVTGGAGEIGKETARLFLHQGAKVVLVDLSQTSLENAKVELEKYGEVITVQADVSQESDVINYVNKAIEHFRSIDIFFNNAGIEGKVSPLIDQSIDDFDKVMSVNARGVFLGLKYVLPIMKENKTGSVINTSSDAGWAGEAGISPYVASKHAVVGLTKTAALEVANENVRVNSIHPTSVNTRMMRSLEEGENPDGAMERKQQYEQVIPLGRYAEAADIAKLVLFLASDDSSFITGSQYRIDGGVSASSN
ncbi:SDR family oxidoreductase [Salicibibacter cibarius]|uniref:SDR family oxidoreductase n=1 Tax=Salicibibacter cibarius TaxID=2743000 RepID=A0A7T6Z3I1_9BACI|nr:SDR family NAD(P)-dependent oxidoreductase [Salicibibacter cibarius]QQK75746.1 SDR family oxidoreductase [Salicibibacter cibarius]